MLTFYVTDFHLLHITACSQEGQRCLIAIMSQSVAAYPHTDLIIALKCVITSELGASWRGSSVLPLRRNLTTPHSRLRLGGNLLSCIFYLIKAKLIMLYQRWDDVTHVRVKNQVSSWKLQFSSKFKMTVAKNQVDL